jgi:hypothetical protein
LIIEFYDSVKNKNHDYHNFCQEEVGWTTIEEMPNGEDVSDFHLFLRATLQKMLSNFAEFHAQPTDFLNADDKVAAIGNY